MTERGTLRDNLITCAGIILGPAAWAANTELGQILPYVDCPAGQRFSAVACLLAVLISIGGALISAHARTPVPAGAASEKITPRNFLALLSSLTGLLFAFALALQSLSALILSPCER